MNEEQQNSDQWIPVVTHGNTIHIPELQHTTPVPIVTYIKPQGCSTPSQVVKNINSVPNSTSHAGAKKVIAVPCSAPNSVIKNGNALAYRNPDAVTKNVNAVPSNTNTSSTTLKNITVVPYSSPQNAVAKNINAASSSASNTAVKKGTEIFYNNTLLKNFSALANSRPNAVVKSHNAPPCSSTTAAAVQSPNNPLYNSPAPVVKYSSAATRLTITGLLSATKQGDLESIQKSIKIFGYPANGTKTTDYVLLQTAIQKKYNDIAKFYINSGCSVNDNSNGNNKNLATPLYLAVEHKEDELVTLLLQRGAVIDIKNEKTGMTPVHLAANKKFFHILYKLLHYSCNINLCDSLGRTVLHILLFGHKENDNEKIFIEIIRKVMFKKSCTSLKYNGETALHLAASMKQKMILSTLLEIADSVNEVNSLGNTVLHSLLSVSHGNVNDSNEQENLEIVKKLVSKGANLNLKNQNGQTPLHLAAKNKHFEVLSYFLLYKLDLDICDQLGHTTLFYLLDNFLQISPKNLNQYLRLIKTLVVYGARVDKINTKSSDYVVHFHTHFKNIMWILADGKGAHNYRDCNGNSFLHIALSTNPIDINIVQVLLKNGFKADVQNSRGMTPIHMVAQKKLFDLLEIFLQVDSFNVNVCDNLGNTILHYVIENFNSNKFKDILDTLLSKGALVDLKNKCGHSPVFIACKNKCNGLVLMLLKLSQDLSSVLDFRDDYNNSLLHVVLYNFITGYEQNSLEATCEIVKILMKTGAAIDLRNHSGEMPLHLAIKIYEKILIEIFLKMSTSANINGNNGKSLGYFLNTIIERNKPSEMLAKEAEIVHFAELLLRNGAKIDKDGHANLINAITLDLKKLAELLLNHTDNFNTLDAAGNSVLHIYFEKKVKNSQIIKLFIYKGVSLNAQNALGQAPLHLAVKNSDFESSRILLEFSADIKVTDNKGNNVVHTLMLTGTENTELLEFLILKGADVHLKNNLGYTPLYLACLKNFSHYCKVLIKYGADVQVVDKNGYTLLHALSEFNVNQNKHKKKEIVDLLIKCKLSASVPIKNGITPLHLAAERGELNMIEFLLNNGAKVDCKNDETGATPIHIAAKNNRADVIGLLLKDNVTDVDIQQKDRRTALHIAVHEEQIDALMKLLECGADVNLCDNFGKTALHWTCWYENVSGTEHLLKNGADVNITDKKGLVPYNFLVCKLDEMHPLFYKQVLMLQEAGFLVDPKLIKALNDVGIDTNEMFHYQNNYRSEILYMKEVYLDPNVRLFDLFRMSLNKLSIYMNNPVLQTILEPNELQKKLPFYASWIQVCYSKGKIRNKLQEKAEKLLNKLVSVKVSKSCCEMIFSYLDNESLINLIKSDISSVDELNETISELKDSSVKKMRLNE